jgi:hypothetical protein
MRELTQNALPQLRARCTVRRRPKPQCTRALDLRACSGPFSRGWRGLSIRPVRHCPRPTPPPPSAPARCSHLACFVILQVYDLAGVAGVLNGLRPGLGSANPGRTGNPRSNALHMIL